jgi:hypothetical protein
MRSCALLLLFEYFAYVTKRKMGNCTYSPIRETITFEYAILYLKNGKIYSKKSSHLYRHYSDAYKAGFLEGESTYQPLTITFIQNRRDKTQQVDTIILQKGKLFFLFSFPYTLFLLQKVNATATTTKLMKMTEDCSHDSFPDIHCHNR